MALFFCLQFSAARYLSGCLQAGTPATLWPAAIAGARAAFSDSDKLLHALKTVESATLVFFVVGLNGVKSPP